MVALEEFADGFAAAADGVGFPVLHMLATALGSCAWELMVGGEGGSVPCGIDA